MTSATRGTQRLELRLDVTPDLTAAWTSSARPSREDCMATLAAFDDVFEVLGGKTAAGLDAALEECYLRTKVMQADMLTGPLAQR
jgi:hypothetical protein